MPGGSIDSPEEDADVGLGRSVRATDVTGSQKRTYAPRRAVERVAEHTEPDVGEGEEEEEYKPYVPVKQRRLMEANRLLQRRGRGIAAGSTVEAEAVPASEAKQSLLVSATQLKKEQPELTGDEKQAAEELDMFERLAEKKELMSVRELAKGIKVGRWGCGERRDCPGFKVLECHVSHFCCRFWQVVCRWIWRSGLEARV